MSKEFMTTILFDKNIAKEIQNQNIKGEIVTRNGKNVRIICWDKKVNDPMADFPIVALVDNNGREDVWTYTEKGYIHQNGEISDYDLVMKLSLTLICNKDNVSIKSIDCPFHPFDKVLVRDTLTDPWQIDIFRSYKKDGDENGYKYNCISDVWNYCIPYEGNEILYLQTI